MDADIDAFSLVVEWLYRGSIKCLTAELSLPLARAFIKTQIDLYLLAEELEINGLTDVVMGSIGKCYYLKRLYPLKVEIDPVFTHTKTGSPLRNYMTDAFRFTLLNFANSENHIFDRPTTAELWEIAKTHDELGKAVFYSLRKGEPEPKNPHGMRICCYHHHGSDDPCPVRGQHFNDKIEPSVDKTRPIDSPASKSSLPVPKVNQPDSPTVATPITTPSNVALSHPSKQEDGRSRASNGTSNLGERNDSISRSIGRRPSPPKSHPSPAGPTPGQQDLRNCFRDEKNTREASRNEKTRRQTPC